MSGTCRIEASVSNLTIKGADQNLKWSSCETCSEMRGKRIVFHDDLFLKLDEFPHRTSHRGCRARLASPPQRATALDVSSAKVRKKSQTTSSSRFFLQNLGIGGYKETFDHEGILVSYRGIPDIRKSINKKAKANGCYRLNKESRRLLPPGF